MGAFGLVALAVSCITFYALNLMSDQVRDLDIARRPLLDKKSKLMSDSIFSIKKIKFNAWEWLILDKLRAIRRQDNSLLLKNFTLQGVCQVCMAIIPSLIGVICIAYVKIVQGREMGVETAYVILLFLNYMKKELVASNQAIIQINATIVSFKRIATFLKVKDFEAENEETYGETELELLPEFGRESNNSGAGVAVRLNNCSMSWKDPKFEKRLKKLIERKNQLEETYSETSSISSASSRPRLNPRRELCLLKISMKIQKNSFVAIIGRVGSGKSSLFRGLLHDLKVVSGYFQVNGSLAYISQEAFLISGTLRDNILFGKEYNEEAYEKVLDLSQLRPDLAILGEGDATFVGERGLNLSGGQKQRISIARALYSDSDIYLVDDCMSALDAHVGAAILEEVFFGYLKGKTILMSTHRYHILDRVDYIYALENGQVFAEGPYDEIIKKKQIKKLMKTAKKIINNNENEEKKESKKVQNKRNNMNKNSLKISLEEISKNKKNSITRRSHQNTEGSQEEEELLNLNSDNFKEKKSGGFIKISTLKFYFSRGGKLLTALVYTLFTASVVQVTFSDWWTGAWVNNQFDSIFSNFEYLTIALALAIS